MQIVAMLRLFIILELLVEQISATNLKSDGGFKFALKRDNLLLTNCTELFYEQYLDHFNYETGSTPNNVKTFLERYFVCGGSKWKANNTIFFYLGNEANVELYINNTGLMWENADSFNAIMIFAEHRYWGKSIPFNDTDLMKDNKLYRFVSPDQAMADYAVLIEYIKTSWSSWSSPIIGFGGSYGGMLCSWFSIKYPQWIDGCIAGSAPILDFEGLHPPINPNYYSQIITYDASTDGGSLPNDLCKNNIHETWQYIFKFAKTIQGRNTLSSIFKFCQNLPNETIANATAYWAADALSSMAMGSYPYPSSYMTGGHGDLPPYPLRIGCTKFFNNDFKNNSNDLLSALSNTINILHNVTQDIKCYDINDNLKDYVLGYVNPNSAWNWMACTTIFLRGAFAVATSDGINDMFWDNPWNATQTGQGCYNSIGVYPRYDWAEINYGGFLLEKSGVQNIVFSNGLCDPWSGGGVHFNNTKNGLYSISTGMVGHHIDLMFSNKNDPESVLSARNFELQQIQHWVTEKTKNK